MLISHTMQEPLYSADNKEVSQTPKVKAMTKTQIWSCVCLFSPVGALCIP